LEGVMMTMLIFRETQGEIHDVYVWSYKMTLDSYVCCH
jgi:hypothetical protein